jgi:hypothetical protein
MPKDIKPHQLVKQAPYNLMSVEYEGSSNPTTVTGTNGWKGLISSNGLYPIAVYRTYFDLAGWSREDLTTFVQGVDIQKSHMPVVTAPGTLTLVQEIDILSTRRITDAEIQAWREYPGFLPSTVDIMQVTYGQTVEYAENGNIGGTFVRVGAGTFGTGDPSAMDKLHWTRIYPCVNQGQATSMGIYPTNCVVQAVTAKEKDLVWMERLRRSYVLQDRTDV